MRLGIRCHVQGCDAAAAQALPHAWGGRAQIELLKRQLGAMADGVIEAITDKIAF